MPQITRPHFSGVSWREGGDDADRRSRDPVISNSVERQNAKLRDRNEELEEIVRKLRKTLAPRMLFPLEWHLNRGETTVLACLYTSPDGFRSNVMLRACAESFSANSDSYQVASVRIFNLRKKLRPFGIRIITRHSEGYILPSDAHKIVEAALRKENE